MLFPFGFGLSYTTFSYESIAVNTSEITDNENLKVTVSVRNSGDRAGKEVVQLYVHDVLSSVYRPVRELKGFEKITLEPGEIGTVEFILETFILKIFTSLWIWF